MRVTWLPSPISLAKANMSLSQLLVWPSVGTYFIGQCMTLMMGGSSTMHRKTLGTLLLMARTESLRMAGTLVLAGSKGARDCWYVPSSMSGRDAKSLAYELGPGAVMSETGGGTE